MKDRNTLLFYQLQGNLRVPLVHHHEFARVQEADQELGVTAGDVEQGHIGKDGALPRRIFLHQFGIHGIDGSAHEQPGV